MDSAHPMKSRRCCEKPGGGILRENWLILMQCSMARCASAGICMDITTRVVCARTRDTFEIRRTLHVGAGRERSGLFSTALGDRREIHVMKRVCSPRDDVVAIGPSTVGIIPLSAELS
jgi:hypothetical protein